MIFDPRQDLQQYQVKTEAPFGTFPLIPTFESAFHQPWSEPVRFRISKGLAVAIAASGLFAPTLNPNAQITQNFESRWHQAWSEPVRLRPRLRTGSNPYGSSFFDNTPNPTNQLQGWFINLSLPVWPKKGLRAQYQHFYEAPVRYLPPANVTMRLATTELNTDVALFGIDVITTTPIPYTLFAGANVSIEQIPAMNGGAASIEEND